MMSLFGTERWREAIPLQGLQRREFLLTLFEDQLRAQSTVKHVRSFQLRTQDGNGYRLVFATGNKKGLALIKAAFGGGSSRLRRECGASTATETPRDT